jgi:hypothetical protein
MLAKYTKKRDSDKKKANLKTLGRNEVTADNRDGKTTYLTAEALGQSSGRHRLILLSYTAQFCGERKEAWISSQGKGFAGPYHAKQWYQGRKRQTEMQCDRNAYVAGDDHHAVGPPCMRGVRQMIVEGDMEHPLTSRPVLDEMAFVTSQFLDPVRDKFRLHDFSHIGEKLMEMRRQPSGAL